MRSAKLETSKRLQRVLRVLKRWKRLSTQQIIQRANVCAVNSCISELRMNGYTIECTQVDRVWYYSLKGE